MIFSPERLQIKTEVCTDIKRSFLPLPWNNAICCIGEPRACARQGRCVYSQSDVCSTRIRVRAWTNQIATQL